MIFFKGKGVSHGSADTPFPFFIVDYPLVEFPVFSAHSWDRECHMPGYCNPEMAWLIYYIGF